MALPGTSGFVPAALPPLARRPAVSVADLLGMRSRQRPMQAHATLADALAASMPKSLADTLSEAIGLSPETSGDE